MKMNIILNQLSRIFAKYLLRVIICIQNFVKQIFYLFNDKKNNKLNGGWIVTPKGAA